MNNRRYLVYLSALIMAVYGCKPKNTAVDLSITPDAGTSYKQGDKVSIKVSYPASLKADSVVYLLDSVRFAGAKDSSAVQLPTDTLGLGPVVITARVYSDGKPQEVSTNINLLAAKAPEEYTYNIQKTFPHDTSSFTEGLEYRDGVLYESDGGYCRDSQHSSLRKVDVSGKILKKLEMSCDTFAEGITVMGDKLIQLTYHERVGFVYDKNTLKLLSTFPFTQGDEGWGMCNDGKNLYCNTGSNRIFVMDKDNYRTVRTIDVYDDQGPVNQLNEMEYIDGLIYANVWQKDLIIAINPKTGAVVKRANLIVLTETVKKADSNADVLNGIAWDSTGKRMFVTGKNWPNLYQIQLVKK